MKKVRVALIGAGYISDYHARGLQTLPDVEIAAVVGMPIEAAKEFAQKYNIKEVTTDALSLVNRDDIDAVLISTPNKFHAPYAIEFMNNGKDIFVEKPMAMNPDEGEAVIDAAQKNDRIVLVGHMWRFDEEAQFVKKVVDSGKLGKIVKTKGYGIHENWGPGGWFTQKEIAGGGALADMGVHAIDTVRYILGDPKPKEVYAKIGTYYGDYDVDDTGIIMITWDNGTTSIIESGWWHPHMDGPEAATQIFGTKGYVSLFPTELKINDEKENKEFKIPKVQKEEHCDQSIYTRQMKHFIECIRTRKQPVPGLSEGQTVLQIVDAAYRSSETGEAIKI
ncbi:oxidoreductase-like [hydrothermal vent metagenome]|uniref:Oxidoreductase-like n=1 Tax=hydrothermal vent metagenome TaxID=652676 RepID=A0A3B1C7Y6_9ZZZZ